MAFLCVLASEAAVPTENEGETIENIENFIQDEPRGTSDTDSVVTAAASTNGSPSKKKDDKTKEEWVTLIFGEDGKEVSRDKKDSVYDINPDDDDLAGN